MRTTYRLKTVKLQEIQLQKHERFTKLLELIDNGRKIIYIDEIIFKPYKVEKKSWAKKGQNQVLQKEGLSLKTMAATVAISMDRGLEGYQIKQKSMSKRDTKAIIEYLGAFNHQKGIVIFWDNLRSHHSYTVQDQIKAQQWTCLFNAPYSPEFHCIEEIFSYVKKVYKEKVISQDFNINQQQHNVIIQQSIECIELELVRKVIQRHLEKMKSYLNLIQANQF
ncbi:hypothetical protein OXYTRIMIC_284 [Oxytricha trifallax]|uniref:Tc1-like transposase DDE domain-containing protein n=1 Tax=Oxytricha trifallax TaxID=1172189 RepID=A0A073HYR3_9SPIT|nr:hypothetical protein OXYTRIMIC_284 [Oxytricha trifallax]